MALQYCVIENASPRELEKEVTEYLQRGWSLVGGIAIDGAPYDSEGNKGYEWYAQAIVRDSAESLPTNPSDENTV